MVEKFLKSENGAVKLSQQEQKELWSRVDKLKKHKYELDIIKLHLYPSRDPIEVKIHLKNGVSKRVKVPSHATKFILRNLQSPVLSLKWYYVAPKDWESEWKEARIKRDSFMHMRAEIDNYRSTGW